MIIYQSQNKIIETGMTVDSFEKVCDFSSLLFLAQLCTKILFTHKNLSLFEQGTMCSIIT